MAPEPQILYLEPDDEITSVVRRLRETDASRLVLVAPGRTRATSSAIALRLLASVAAEESRELALVADPLARALAGEAEIPVFASVAEATAGEAHAVEATPAHRAAIHVVRPAEAAQSTDSRARDETRPVVLPRPQPAQRRNVASSRRRSRAPWIGLAVMFGALLLAGGVAAVVLPGATIRITPETKSVGPVTLEVRPTHQERVSGQIPLTMSGKATGDHVERTEANGTVVFQSGNPGRCRVPQGTRVAAGNVVFETAETVVVPEGKLTGRGIAPGAKSVGIAAFEPGPSGNVAAGAIDTIQNANLTFCLRGFLDPTQPIVNNPQATAGGAENHSSEIKQADVDALVKQLTAALTQQLATALATHDDVVMIVPTEPEKPTVATPDGLVGKRGEETFELTGTIAYDRPAVRRADVDVAARQQLLEDTSVLPPETTIEPATIRTTIEKARLDGGAVAVTVSVTAEALSVLDINEIRARVGGMTREQARAALEQIGPVGVELWPGWVDRIPQMDWRVRVEVTRAPTHSAAPSGSP